MERAKATVLFILLTCACAWGGSFATLYGDPNCDGVIDNFDINPFEALYGTTTGVPACSSDFDGDGDVDSSDLAIFLIELGDR